MPRILIVDDEADIRGMIAAYLGPHGFTCLEASDADEAERCIREQQPDLMLLDWMLPGRSGLELARQLKKDNATSGLPIIMLTARTQEANMVWGLESGADDYVTKPFSPRELRARIQAVLRRAPGESVMMVEIAGLCLEPESHRLVANGKPVELAPTEYRLLKLLMTHADRVYSRAKLIDLVWGDHSYVEERTVDVHVRRLRKALEASGHDRLVQTVRGAGYRFSPR